QAEPRDDAPQKLLDDLSAGVPPDEAAEQLGLVLEAIIENYGEYRDYNSTTTQSDRGELLYMLLDFLRLRTKYDRVCCNLKPVVLAHEPTGVGLDVPAWLVALEEEVEDALYANTRCGIDQDLPAAIQPVLLSYDEARQQLEVWSSRQA